MLCQNKGVRDSDSLNTAGSNNKRKLSGVFIYFLIMMNDLGYVYIYVCIVYRDRLFKLKLLLPHLSAGVSIYIKCRVSCQWCACSQRQAMSPDFLAPLPVPQWWQWQEENTLRWRMLAYNDKTPSSPTPHVLNSTFTCTVVRWSNQVTVLIPLRD